MDFFSTLGLDPARLRAQAAAAAQPPGAAQPATAQTPAPVQAPVQAPIAQAPQNIVAARAGMMPAAPPSQSDIASTIMQRFGGRMPQPAPAMQPAPNFMQQRQPQFGAPQSMPVQSSAIPANGGMQSFMQHPGVQNFMRQRFGLA